MTTQSTIADVLLVDHSAQERALREIGRSIRARTVERLRDARIEADLGAWVIEYAALIDAARAQRKSPPAASASALFVLVLQAEQAEITETEIDAASALELYGLSLTLFDAVQDDELDPPFCNVGPHVASNAALTMFLLACHGLTALGDRGGDRERQGIRDALLHHSLLAGSAQHRDLSSRRPRSLDEAIVQASGKTSLHALAAELAAIHAGSPLERIDLYRSLGRQTALLRQLGNDLRDLTSRWPSRDIANGKFTLPMAFVRFGEAPELSARLDAAITAEPPREAEARRVLAESGAMTAVRRLLNDTKRSLDATASQLRLRFGPMALFMTFIDEFVQNQLERASRAAVSGKE
jgi:hypothetical protein